MSVSNSHMAAGGKKTHPHVALVTACVFGGFAVALILLQVSTTEAGIQGYHVTSVVPNFDLLRQIPGIFQGGLGASQMAALYAWLLEFLYIGLAVVNDIVSDGLSVASKFFGGLIKVFIFIIYAFNYYTDYKSGIRLGPGDGGSWAFATVTVLAILALTWLTTICVNYWLKNK
ncbi:MAG: hypothetical protein PVS3B3_18860 [Ktedonobacteraceae bacterium]